MKKNFSLRGVYNKKYKYLSIMFAFIFLIGYNSKGETTDELKQMTNITQELLKNKNFEYIERYALKNKFKRIEIDYNNGMTGKVKIFEKNKIANIDENNDKREELKKIYEATKELKKRISNSPYFFSRSK